MSSLIAGIRRRLTGLIRTRSSSETLEKNDFLADAEKHLRAMLRARGIWESSKMMVAPPNIREPETGKPLPRRLMISLQNLLLNRFGENERFIRELMSHFEVMSVKNAHDILTKLGELLIRSEIRGFPPRKLIPMLYVMISDPECAGLFKAKGNFYCQLAGMVELVEAGKDPLQEYQFDSYLEFIIERDHLLVLL